MGCLPNKVENSEFIELGEWSLFKQSKLAEGAYGDVWKCKAANSDTLYALKQIRLQTT
jgi:hypothetical protein